LALILGRATGDEARIREELFGPAPAATVLLAVDGADVLGMATYSRLWPAAGDEASLYLKELFVRLEARRRGVARALMTRLRETAEATGARRVEWTADTDNAPALALYKALGFEPHDGKLFYRWV
jgi:GNAT superfamily N-acetyltransferase